MGREEAEALAGFVNRCNDRYRAEVLPLGGSENWVILTDRRTGGNPPPVVNPADYLRDARGNERLSPECRELLATWLADHGDGDGDGADARPATGGGMM